MLFDLRGRGRRRTVQAIYLSLAILMGGGLVLFGIGGNTNGGLFDAFGGGSGNQTSGDEVFEKRVADLEARTVASPRDAVAWAALARARAQVAGTGDNVNSSTGAYTDAGIAELRAAADAWERHLALAPTKPDASVASQMVQVFGENGLREYDKAVRAMEVVIDDREPSSGLFAQLAVLAHAATQSRKSELAKARALQLVPADQRKALGEQIEQAYTQIDQLNSAEPASSG